MTLDQIRTFIEEQAHIWHEPNDPDMYPFGHKMQRLLELSLGMLNVMEAAKPACEKILENCISINCEEECSCERKDLLKALKELEK